MNRFIGCAGWGIPAKSSDRFPGEGSHLERYARQFTAVEINSSFYRPHRPQTYERWAASVPTRFRFSVKLPKVITHTQQRVDIQAELDRFLLEIVSLGPKLGPILVQLPPRLRFEEKTVLDFFQTLRDRFAGEVVCEPRHETWFTPEGADLLTRFQIARVGADPSRSPGGEKPGAWEGLLYYRLHGSPEVYVSNYSMERIKALAEEIQKTPDTTPIWCIFDNTAEGAATVNALSLLDRV